MSKIQAIIFDFDGVILESVDVKGWAFGKLFEAYPKHTERIVAYHHANGGMSRFEKFRYIYKEILKQPLADDTFDELGRRYSDLVFEQVLSCPYVPGALEFIKKYDQALPFFIVSATPQEEMQRVVDEKELSPYFQGVYGSPEKKVPLTRNILEQHGFDGQHVIFIGDAMSDYEAAKENGLIFIARVPRDKENIFKGCSVDYVVNDLYELKGIIECVCFQK